MADNIFNKQDSVKKPTIIAKRIIELIENGSIKSGDKLPNELEIVRQSDISRSSVREALSALEIMGIIKRVPGEGTFVCNSKLAANFSHSRVLEKFLEDTESVGGSFSALEARMAIEPSVAMMAARRAEPEQIARMGNILEKSRSALVKNNVKEFLDYDADFHLAIAEATNNEEIVSITKDLLHRADIHMWQRYKEDMGLLGATVESHEKILSAIQERDTQKAGFFAEQHLASHVK